MERKGISIYQLMLSLGMVGCLTEYESLLLDEWRCAEFEKSYGLIL